jgi:hypothetical protein
LVFEALEPVVVESRVFVAALEISESKETNLKESGASGGRMSHVGNFQAYKEKGIVLERIRVSEVLAIAFSKKCT